jgi:hypothetical protein
MGSECLWKERYSWRVKSKGQVVESKGWKAKGTETFMPTLFILN